MPSAVLQSCFQTWRRDFVWSTGSYQCQVYYQIFDNVHAYHQLWWLEYSKLLKSEFWLESIIWALWLAKIFWFKFQLGLKHFPDTPAPGTSVNPWHWCAATPRLMVSECSICNTVMWSFVLILVHINSRDLVAITTISEVQGFGTKKKKWTMMKLIRCFCEAYKYNTDIYIFIIWIRFQTIILCRGSTAPDKFMQVSKYL